MISFWTVKDNSQKLKCICELVHRHFTQGQRVLVLAPNRPAADYVDQLLWKMPPESFLPHVLASEPLQAAIVVTSQMQNLNEAQILINLCPTHCPIAKEFSQIHELDDVTDPSKAQLSKDKQKAYTEAGLDVQVCNP